MTWARKRGKVREDRETFSRHLRPGHSCLEDREGQELECLARFRSRAGLCPVPAPPPPIAEPLDREDQTGQPARVPPDPNQDVFGLS